MEYWSNGVMGNAKKNSDINQTLHYSNTPSFLYYSILHLMLQHSIIPLSHHSIIASFHYSTTPLFHYSITPFLHYSIFYIPSTWHINVMMAVATIILTMLVTTAEVAAYPTADALLSHCIPRRHPESATKMPKTAL